MRDKRDKIIRSAGGVVVRRENENWKIALLYKNYGWFFPKGRIGIKENVKQAALREIKEELGIPLKKLRIVKRLGSMEYIASQVEDNYNLRPKKVTVFLVETSEKFIRPLKKEGFKKAKWFNQQEALRLVPYPEMKTLIFRVISLLRGNYHDRIKTVVVGVGGKGERMKLKNFPKLLLPVYGKPFLWYLINLLLSYDDFKQIYLFTSYYAKEIERFVQSNFDLHSGRLKIVFTGAKTITQQIYSAKNLRDDNFLYIDGNVIYDKTLFDLLIRKHSLFNPLITLAVSPFNLAPTHLQMQIDSHGRIINPSSYFLNNHSSKTNVWHSMGVFAINRYIFDLLPDFIYFHDFDFIIKGLLETRNNFFMVIPVMYKKEWYCLHDKNDYRFINKQGGNFFGKYCTRIK